MGSCRSESTGVASCCDTARWAIVALDHMPNRRAELSTPNTQDAASIERLERAGYVVLKPAEASALGRVLALVTRDEIEFALGRSVAAFEAAMRKFGL